ncbi:hypothetical protein F5X68DRAFT_229650 [Plectosphaerella plurivora]|uniref:Uncharacterized protein n=1 Tax=Plectosphaerella plurivora TaxID=936078 RepID=A0A9P8VGP3_9PEZI|nr:hypothetical protein F5X68DRAFT_229650 [Plectosphaerella plurivora]
MADPSSVNSSFDKGLHPVPEIDESVVPLNTSFSSSASWSPPPSARPPAQSFFRREAYHRVPSDGAVDLSSLDGRYSPGPLTQEPLPTSFGESNNYFSPDDGTGGDRNKRWSIPRVPVGSKLSSPSVDTPRSFHGLMDTPKIGPQSPDPGRLPRAMTTGPPPPQAEKAGWFGGFFKKKPKTPAPRKSPQPSLKEWFRGAWLISPPEDPRHMGGHSRLGDMPHHTHDPGQGHFRGEPGSYDQVRMDNLNRVNGSPAPGHDNGDDGDDDDDKPLHARYTQAPHYCDAHRDVHANRVSWLSVSIMAMSLYSTALSCMWFIVAIVQPRWGRSISTSGAINPATASVVFTLFAKTIEMSFVTVFITFLGQVLTRRSFVKRAQGMTLAEMTMRNWVIQPGSLITHWNTIPYAGLTFLGVISLIATVAATFYTTASEAMVSPKIKFGNWEGRTLQGLVKYTYANPAAVSEACATPLRAMDEVEAGGACLNVQYSGQSYRNLLSFLNTWNDINKNGTSMEMELKNRPVGTSLLYDNTTMTAAWIETEHSNVTKLHEEYSRIINNVTLAMPHPGVYDAATDRINGILQPDDLADVGEYAIKAGVVSPAVNVLCVNMSEDELKPLVYTAWPHATNDTTVVPGQWIGHQNWTQEVPATEQDGFLNRTVVDDIFRWGPDYERRPPVFQMYPADYNILTSPLIGWNQPRRDALYMLMKSQAITNYTMCELRSWLSPDCSTQFNISGIAGAHLRAHCDDDNDPDSYRRSHDAKTAWGAPDADWVNLATQWQLSMDLNGGLYNNNASNARILSQLVLQVPSMPTLMPSMAEALAVLASSTLTIASLGTPYKHFWSHPAVKLDPGMHEPFNASIRTQEYTSSHTFAWQNVFYVVLFVVFAINVFCLVYLLLGSGMVTDYTDPQNLFALAVNSPPTYNRAKGRTSEIPPSPSAGRSRSMSNATPAATAAAEAASLFDPRQVDRQLEAQLGARPPSSSNSSGGGVGHRRGWRGWLVWLLLLPMELIMWLVVRPVAEAIDFVRETPAVIPAVLAMVFLYVGMPLLIAWDIL